MKNKQPRNRLSWKLFSLLLAALLAGLGIAGEWRTQRDFPGFYIQVVSLASFLTLLSIMVKVIYQQYFVRIPI